MEMTFPHHALRQDSVIGRTDHKAMLAVAIARQANSRTVRALRRVEQGAAADVDQMAQRVHYFARGDGENKSARGAFWRDFETQPTCERPVYQADLANIKDVALVSEATGEQLNHAGHGALRTI
jgi:hypothetical protein